MQLRAIVNNLLSAAAQRHANRVAGDALWSMDEHLLRDIGADRADAGRIARHGR